MDIKNTLKKVIVEIVDEVDISSITQDTHLINDLGIDSLEIIDIIYEINQIFNIKIPVEEWMELVNEGKAKLEDYFVINKLEQHIQNLIN